MDTKIWIEDNLVEFTFYQKPMASMAERVSVIDSYHGMLRGLGYYEHQTRKIIVWHAWVQDRCLERKGGK